MSDTIHFGTEGDGVRLFSIAPDGSIRVYKSFVTGEGDEIMAALRRFGETFSEETLASIPVELPGKIKIGPDGVLHAEQDGSWFYRGTPIGKDVRVARCFIAITRRPSLSFIAIVPKDPDPGTGSMVN